MMYVDCSVLQLSLDGAGTESFPIVMEANEKNPAESVVVRILLVDDNPSVRHYLRAILEQQTLWRVCGEARTGAEALKKVVESPPDLILLDYQMPDLNGVDIARQICKLFPKIPILMVTLHLSRQLADAARSAGVRGACAKQDIGSVVEAVEVLLREQTYFPALPAGN
jgi:DNA-binding NarL/FixJ family response regulator